MRKSTRKLVQKIIDEEYLTDWEFIIQAIAPELDEDEYLDAVDEISQMVRSETIKRHDKLWEEKK